MVKALSKLTFSLCTLSALGISFWLGTSSALAFTFNNDGSIAIGVGDVGQSFNVGFDGNVATQDVTGLSSLSTFTFLGFTTIGQTTQAKFDIALKNTSTNGISSRTSALGFNVDPNLGSAKVSAGGLFSNTVLNGSLPNQFGALELCFTDGSTCQGGGSGGVSSGQNSQTFSPTLTFSSANVSSFALSNFGVRYQSISGTNLGNSGTGKGTVQKPKDPNKIPEPLTVSGILLTGMGLLYSGKKRKQSEPQITL